MKIEEAIRYFEAKENETVGALAWLKNKALNDHIRDGGGRLGSAGADKTTEATR